MMSTKMTRGGQTTVPKEIRDSLGIGETSRVYWTFDGTRAYLTAEPVVPLAVESEEDLRARLAEAEASRAQGHVRDAADVAGNLRERYGLA